MKCKRDGCSNEAVGRGKYCSGTCKTLYNRNKKRNTKTVTKSDVGQMSSIGTTSTSSRGVDPNGITLEKMAEAMKLITDTFPVIEVWRGDSPFLKCLIEKNPRIEKTEYLPKDKAYIAAGVGVLCGADIYERIRYLGYRAVWVDDPPKL